MSSRFYPRSPTKSFEDRSAGTSRHIFLRGLSSAQQPANYLSSWRTHEIVPQADKNSVDPGFKNSFSSISFLLVFTLPNQHEWLATSRILGRLPPRLTRFKPSCVSSRACLLLVCPAGGLTLPRVLKAARRLRQRHTEATLAYIQRQPVHEAKRP